MRVEARGDHADLHLTAHALVDDRAEDDVRLGVGRGVDDLGRLVDLEQGQVGAAGDREQHAARAVDRLLEERRRDRLTCRVRCAGLARSVADAHERGAGVGHDRLHVGEVEVDEPGHRDEVADALDALAEDIVDDAERVDHRRALLRDLEQPVVRDRDERVDLVDELLDPLLGEQLALRAFERERARDDGDDERPDVLGDLRYDRGGAGPCAATHAGGHEDHVGLFERLVELLAVVLGGLAAHRGIGAGAKTLRDLVADAELVRGVGEEQGLRVGVHRDELDAHQLGADHAVDRIGPATTDADDFDQREVFNIRP